jgi:hypothetical protein
MLLDKPPLPLGDVHLDDLRAPCDEIGQKARRFVLERTDVQLCRRGEMGDRHGIDGIGLARLPKAWARGRTSAGFATTTGNPPQPLTTAASPAAARLAATTVSKPPVASTATSSGAKGARRAINTSSPVASPLVLNISPRG